MPAPKSEIAQPLAAQQSGRAGRSAEGRADSEPAVAASPAEFDCISGRFAFRDGQRVRAFIAGHPEVIRPLPDSLEIVPRYFSPDRRVILEITDDPDAGSESEELFLLIPTAEGPDAAIARLRRLDTDWWLGARCGARCSMNIDVEFV